MIRCFLDSSVLVDALEPSHADHHERAVALLERTSQRIVELHVSATVLFETAYVLERRHRVPRLEVGSLFRNLLALPSVHCRERNELVTTLDLWEQESPLSFADCYHLVLAESLRLDGIYSFDRKMGRYPPVERHEP